MMRQTALEAMWQEDAASISRFVHVHLQWFAAEDQGRTEEPTEHKIRKARERGWLPRQATCLHVGDALPPRHSRPSAINYVRMR